MDSTDFRRRAKALGLPASAETAARERLVKGAGLLATARKHEIDPSYLSRVCKRVATVEMCRHCGQKLPVSE